MFDLKEERLWPVIKEVFCAPLAETIRLPSVMTDAVSNLANGSLKKTSEGLEASVDEFNISHHSGTLAPQTCLLVDWAHGGSLSTV
jgi:hypothetical protein